MSDLSGPTESALAKAVREQKEVLIEIEAAVFGNSVAYTTVVIFGGYAALFTVWTQTRDFLSPTNASWVGLLTGVSLAAFVALEVFRMIVKSVELMKVRSLLSESNPAQFRDRYNALQAASNRFNRQVLLPVWIAALAITVLTGFGAAFVLMGAFVGEILYPTTVPVTDFLQQGGRSE